MRPLKGGLKANRAIVGTDAQTVRPYMRMNNQLVNLFTLSTGQLKTGEAVLSYSFRARPRAVPLPHRGCTFDSAGSPTTGGYLG